MIVLENVIILGIIFCFLWDVRIIKWKFLLRVFINIRLLLRECVVFMFEGMYVKED